MANTRKNTRKGPPTISPMKKGGYKPKITSPKRSPRTKTKSGAAVDIFTELQGRFITVHRPGEPDYELAVANANLLFRFSRPTFVVKPSSASQVQVIVKLARAQNIAITVKCGGHSYIGASSTDNGILLDLAKMNKAKLDFQAKTMTMEAGALWGKAYRELIGGRHDGWMVNGGRCPPVGTTGFLLGGGIGPFTRIFGMACDSLIEATLVTADGEMVTVSDGDDPESDKGKLFWALRGAGGGSFGVVVEIKIKVHRMQNNDGTVVAGLYTWFPSIDAAKLLRTTMTQFYKTDWPDKMTIDSSWLCDLRGDPKLGIRFTLYYDGSKQDFDRLIEKSILSPELNVQFRRRALPERTTRFLHETLVEQWSQELQRSVLSNPSFVIYSSFCFKNDPATIDNVIPVVHEELVVFKEKFKDEKGLLQVSFIHSGGEATRKAPSATAFNWREAVFHTYIQISWDGKFLERDMRDFAQTLEDRLRPFSLEGRAIFFNFPDGALKSDYHEQAYWGDNHEKLQHVKKIWDKDNYFNSVQGVRLPQAVVAPGAPSSDVNVQDLTDNLATWQWDHHNTLSSYTPFPVYEDAMNQ